MNLAKASFLNGFPDLLFYQSALYHPVVMLFSLFLQVNILFLFEQVK